MVGDGFGGERHRKALALAQGLLQLGVHLHGPIGDRLQGRLVGFGEIVLIRLHQQSLEGLPDASQVGALLSLFREPGRDRPEVGSALPPGGEDPRADGKKPRAELLLRIHEGADETHDGSLTQRARHPLHEISGSPGQRNLLQHQVQTQPWVDLEQSFSELVSQPLEAFGQLLANFLRQASHQLGQLPAGARPRVFQPFGQPGGLGGEPFEKRADTRGRSAGRLPQIIRDEALPGSLLLLRGGILAGNGLRLGRENLLQIDLAEDDGAHVHFLKLPGQASLGRQRARVRSEQAEKLGETGRVQATPESEAGHAPIEEEGRERFQSWVRVGQVLALMQDAGLGKSQLDLRFAVEQASQCGQDAIDRGADRGVLGGIERDDLGSRGDFTHDPGDRIGRVLGIERHRLRRSRATEKI